MPDYLGTISIDGRVIESVKIKADDSEKSQDILAKYVYEKYNKPLNLESGSHIPYYYYGNVINTIDLETLTEEGLLTE
jgi:hypothetical protein